jgi:ppGpp synthetase/RelA/SpoT-type nucleotidyltranferase
MAPAPEIALPSKTHINRCGQRLVSAVVGDYDVAEHVDEIEEAFAVVSDFRAAHAYPMQKIRYGLRSMVRSESAAELVAQRLKRLPRIVRKLHRMENSNLARLEDIGGVRAILRDGPELERVRTRIRKRWAVSISRERDYIQEPKDMGYRAVHFVVRRDGRSIEVQLRTRGQQQWAEAVEAADARLKLNLKDGEGPEEMVEYFAAAGEVIYLNEYGQRVPAEVAERFQAANQAVIDAGYYRA